MTTDGDGASLLDDLILEGATAEGEGDPTPEATPEQDDNSQAEPASEPEIPQKYQGKSAMDLIRMHQDAEKLIGRQGGELGQLRKVADDLLMAAQSSAPTDTATQEPETDFFADPQKATQETVSSVLANDPTIQALKEDANENRKQRAGMELLRAHPDAKEISDSPEFGAWLSESPVRMQMFQTSHQTYNPALAAELMTLFKESKRMAKDTADSAQANRTQDVATASTGAGKSGSEARGKPIFNRESLIQLKIKDPTRYYANIETFKEAYREGRVRDS